MVSLRVRHHVGRLWGLLRALQIVSGVDESAVMDNEVGGAVQIDGKENFVTDNGTSLEVFDKRVFDKRVDVVVDDQIEVFNCI
ncbi:hypothetical protein L1887_16151 [Cichorium endivia]|nr:hypothetical protein L1887_16151 [Cichorium endivia]